MNPAPPLLYAPGALTQVGALARGLGFRRTLIVADHGMEHAGHIAALVASLSEAGVECSPWSNFSANPNSAMIERGREFAAQLEIDSLIGLGGGSSLDATKGINFVLTNGGTMKEYWGYGKATQPLLPMIGIPATTGTGSEAQSYALISDPETHVKMACGDPTASFRYAVLDPLLTLSQPAAVRAASGYDAISHAVETYVTTKRTQSSQLLSRQAWRLLHESFAAPASLDSNADLQLGAWFAGCAIEGSMLGAAHACANPLTARFGITHGVAIAIMLPHVVRWNACPEYADLHPNLSSYLAELAVGLALPLRECGVTMEVLPQLAEDAAQQWTGRHNPRPFDAVAALELYQCAF